MAKRSKPPAAATNAAANSDDSADPSTRPIRLQRALAAAGFGSRRQCEEMILEGRVEVDREIIDKLGTTVVLGESKIYVDGSQLKTRRLVYFLVNKPPGVVTTNSDPEGRPRVIDLVPPGERVFPVGRLDRASEGLILLTNDGELAQRLAHPRFEVPKVYRVTVAGNVTAESLRDMRKGIYIAEGVVRVEGAKVLKVRSKSTELEITLKEGKNREIRRILARLGHKVMTLKRIAIGPLRLADLPTGAYRRVTHEELKRLQSGEPASRPETDSSPESAESSEASAGTKGRVTRKAPQKAPAAKRSSRPPVPRGQAAPSATLGTKPRARKSPAESEFPFPMRQNRVGAVIGSDSPPAARDKPLNLRSADDEEENRIIRPRPKGADKPRRPRPDGRTSADGRTSPEGRPAAAQAKPLATPGGAKGKRKPPVRGQAATGNARTGNARVKQARIESADAEPGFDSIDQPSADQPPRKRPRPPVRSGSSVRGKPASGKKFAPGKSVTGKRDASKRTTGKSVTSKTPSRKSAPGKRPGGRANRRGSARGS
ncbi:MAG: Ribosomal large subunit pseudouridine synthase [Planctomycetota bacterium]